MILVALGFCAYRFAVRRVRSRRRLAPGDCLRQSESAAPAPRRKPASLAPTLPDAPSDGELRSLADWAFEYERMVIASRAATAAQRDQALHLVSHLIVPLVGHVCVCELDDELVRSVRRVLAVQLREDQAPYAARVWTHFVGWARYQAAPLERRNIWTFLDADVLRLYDEFTDG